MLRVFMNRVMKIFGPKRYEVAGKWRRLKEGAYDLYCTSNIIQVIKWRRMTWARHTVSMRNTRGTYRHLVGRPKGKRPTLEDVGKEGRILLKWIFKQWDVRSTDLMDLAQEKDRWWAFVVD